MLPTELAMPFALLLNELATNAVKYGALSKDGGSVHVFWERRGEASLHFVWEEKGGPPVRRSSRRGLGMTLIQNGLPGATVDYRFHRSGIVCAIDLALKPQRENSARPA
jgi:two-component system, chemotaxis family, CheB/CheR fusion protein